VTVKRQENIWIGRNKEGWSAGRENNDGVEHGPEHRHRVSVVKDAHSERRSNERDFSFFLQFVQKRVIF